VGSAVEAVPAEEGDEALLLLLLVIAGKKRGTEESWVSRTKEASCQYIVGPSPPTYWVGIGLVCLSLKKKGVYFSSLNHYHFLLKFKL
jgi:hypothetical protein